MFQCILSYLQKIDFYTGIYLVGFAEVGFWYICQSQYDTRRKKVDLAKMKAKRAQSELTYAKRQLQDAKKARSPLPVPIWPRASANTMPPRMSMSGAMRPASLFGTIEL